MRAFIESEMARAKQLMPHATWEVSGTFYILRKGAVSHSVNLDPGAQPPSKQDMRELLTATIADALASDELHRGGPK